MPAGGRERLGRDLGVPGPHDRRPLHPVPLGADLDAEPVLRHADVRGDRRAERLALGPVRERARTPGKGQGDGHDRPSERRHPVTRAAAHQAE